MGYSSKCPCTPHRRALCLGGKRIYPVSRGLSGWVHGGECPGGFRVLEQLSGGCFRLEWLSGGLKLERSTRL